MDHLNNKKPILLWVIEMDMHGINEHPFSPINKRIPLNHRCYLILVY